MRGVCSIVRRRRRRSRRRLGDEGVHHGTLIYLMLDGLEGETWFEEGRGDDGFLLSVFFVFSPSCPFLFTSLNIFSLEHTLETEEDGIRIRRAVVWMACGFFSIWMDIPP